MKNSNLVLFSMCTHFITYFVIWYNWSFFPTLLLRYCYWLPHNSVRSKLSCIYRYQPLNQPCYSGLILFQSQMPVSLKLLRILLVPSFPIFSTFFFLGFPSSCLASFSHWRHFSLFNDGKKRNKLKSFPTPGVQPSLFFSSLQSAFRILSIYLRN